MERKLDGEDELQKPEDIKSHLTARELQVREPAKKGSVEPDEETRTEKKPPR